MRARWLARTLLPILRRWIADRRPPDFHVVRDDRDVYLRRWWVIPRNDWFNVYLHNMLRDDDPILHDHMYASLSLVLTRGLDEVYDPDPTTHQPFKRFSAPGAFCARRILREGHLVWRSSRMAHQLIVTEPAWTLFVTGPRVKEWGFYCPKGWRHWRDYVALSENPDDSGKSQSQRGRGCGETS